MSKPLVIIELSGGVPDIEQYGHVDVFDIDWDDCDEGEDSLKYLQGRRMDILELRATASDSQAQTRLERILKEIDENIAKIEAS